MKRSEFIQLNDLYVRADYVPQFKSAGLSSMDEVFAFNNGNVLAKANMARFRSRLQVDLNDGTSVFIKRYDKPPVIQQIKNWFSHGYIASTMHYDVTPAQELAEVGINTPEVLAFGHQQGLLCERRSFAALKKIRGEALERRLPACFSKSDAAAIARRKEFISRLALFAKRFHDTGFRHRDFYLAHIFYDGSDFSLIDLQRAITPRLASHRYLIKDLAQLYYSAPGAIFCATHRLRFILTYLGKQTLENADKQLIRAIIAKAGRMACHDRRHGRAAPFLIRNK